MLSILVVAGRALAVVLLASVLWFIVRPLRRRVTDDQVALYLEEHEPSLEATLVSAVEASRTGHGESAALIRRVVEQAIAACQRANATRTVETKPLRRYGVVLAGAAVVARAGGAARAGVHPPGPGGHVPDAAGRGGRALPHHR